MYCTIQLGKSGKYQDIFHWKLSVFEPKAFGSIATALKTGLAVIISSPRVMYLRLHR